MTPVQLTRYTLNVYSSKYKYISRCTLKIYLKNTFCVITLLKREKIKNLEKRTLLAKANKL